MLQLASCPREVTEAADVTLAMLADPQAAKEVAFGPHGAAAGLREGERRQYITSMQTHRGLIGDWGYMFASGSSLSHNSHKRTAFGACNTALRQGRGGLILLHSQHRKFRTISVHISPL